MDKFPEIRQFVPVEHTFTKLGKQYEKHMPHNSEKFLVPVQPILWWLFIVIEAICLAACDQRQILIRKLQAPKGIRFKAAQGINPLNRRNGANEIRRN